MAVNSYSKEHIICAAIIWEKPTSICQLFFFILHLFVTIVQNCTVLVKGDINPFIYVAKYLSEMQPAVIIAHECIY